MNTSAEKSQSDVSSEFDEQARLKMSDRLMFFLQNFRQIMELEKNLRFVLSENEVKKSPNLMLKLSEGGWFPFREIFKLQKIFEEENKFFKAVDFIKRVEIIQNEQDDPKSSESLMIKLNEKFETPLLNFYLRNKDNSEQVVKDLIQKSIFKDHITSIEITETPQAKQELENSHIRKTGKVTSDLSSVISGLKQFLQEFAQEHVVNLAESLFNLDAAPFKPKSLGNPQAQISSVAQLDLGFAKSSLKPSSVGKTTEEDKEQSLLERKRQISQMYQYYNYLIFEKNKESFNDINPDLRKMTYKYDNEVKNAYMTVQASPEVIQAAMGMNVDSQNGHYEKTNPSKEESKSTHPQAKDLPELMKKQSSTMGQSSTKTIRYTKDQILQIYKDLGNFKSPLEDAHLKGVNPENIKFLDLITNSEANVVLQSMRENPPLQKDKVKIVNQMIQKASDNY